MPSRHIHILSCNPDGTGLHLEDLGTSVGKPLGGRVKESLRPEARIIPLRTSNRSTFLREHSAARRCVTAPTTPNVVPYVCRILSFCTIIHIFTRYIRDFPLFWRVQSCSGTVIGGL
jgi:hypothetical protein